jgi:hypothetical protein
MDLGRNLSFCILIIVVPFFSFNETILTGIGKFMGPKGTGLADVAILEGNEFIDRDMYRTGMDLLSSGKVKRIVIALSNIPPSHRPFAFSENYADLVRKEVQSLGLKE